MQKKISNKPTNEPVKPDVKNQAADPTAGAKYVEREQRVYEALKLPGYETPAKADRSFAKLQSGITDAQIQKKLDKLRGPHMHDLIYDGMSPIEKGQWNSEKRKQGMNGKTADPINKVDDYGPVKYDKNGLPNKATPAQMGAMAEKLEEMRQMTGEPDKPKPKKKINPYADVKIAIPTIDRSLLRDPNKEARESALEKMRAYAFTPTPNPDAVKGIGSFRKTIGRKLSAATSRSDWERNNRTTYK